jgi:hypothetical protein
MRGDLMKRLAEADPLRDAEQLDLDAEREADALLARLLATPPEPGASPRPRLRRWTLSTAAVAGIAAAAFAAVNLVGSDAPGPGGVEDAIAAKTVAALTQRDSVFHVLQRKRGTSNLPGANVGPFLAESWHSSEGQFHEKVFADEDGRRGRLLEESAGRRPLDRGVGALLTYDPSQNRLHASGIGGSANTDELPALDPNADPGTTLRQLETRGLLHAAGATQLGDRRAYRLVSDPIKADGGEERFEYLVDSETYLPLRQRWTLHRGSEVFGVDFEFLAYERLPLNAGFQAHLDLDPHPGASCEPGAEEPDEQALGFANPCR